MNAKEASKLKKDQRVMWDGDKDDLGTIVRHSLGKTYVWIKWDKPGSIDGWIYYEDAWKMEKVSG